MTEKIVFFGAEWCPYCQKVLGAMREKQLEFEFVEMPHDHEARKSVKWQEKSFEELFDGNLSIPKMLVNGKKIMGSDEGVAFVNENY